MRRLTLTLVAAGTLALVATTAPTASAVNTSGPPERANAQASPTLRVHTVVSDADVPWDLTFLPKGAMLYTERDRERITYRAANSNRRIVASTPQGVWHEGETGMMSILAARNFAKSRTFYTCHGGVTNGRHDVRVVRWRLNAKHNGARRIEVLVKNLPTVSGRHGGCRLRFGAGGALYVGTGDAAVGTTPQNLKSGGGKVLKVNPKTGRGLRSTRSPAPTTR